MTRSAALNSIYELAQNDERVVFIGTDLAPNTLENFKRDFPDRYFMCGVQEQNCAGLAAGLALEGFIPYVNNIASFLTRRCYEQIIIDICAHNLPVRLLGNGGGAVYQPLGLTHIAQDDLSIMRAIPNMQVICCSDSEEMKVFMQTTTTNLSPMYIRLGKDTDPIVPLHHDFTPARVVKSRESTPSILIISTGIMTDKAIKTASLLPHKQFDDIIEIIHVPVIKPLDTTYILDEAKNAAMVVTMEEGILIGGVGSAVLECLADNNIQIPVLRFGFPDAFPPHYGEQSDLLETYGLTPEKMAARIKEFYDGL